MTALNPIVGAFGERLAARHTLALGMLLLDRNWQGPGGELDLILTDGPALVFCEVKTRHGAAFGLPVEAVHPAKALRLRRLAGYWLRELPGPVPPVRFDVLSVLLGGADRVRVEHRRDVL